MILDKTLHRPHSTCYSDIDFGKAQKAVWQHHVTYWGHCYLLSGRIQQWYFVTKIVLTYCDKKIVLIEKKLLKFETEGQEFAKFLRSVEQFLQTVIGQNNFG